MATLPIGMRCPVAEDQCTIPTAMAGLIAEQLYCLWIRTGNLQIQRKCLWRDVDDKGVWQYLKADGAI